MSVASATKSKRTENREKRRQQLIEATIRCISKHGLGGLTLSDVARTAGLSQGIVNLHFESKDNLLNAALRALADEYRRAFDLALERAGDGAAEKLLALVEMDLKPSICDRRKLAVWFAFWGEVKAVPTYQKICQERDRHYAQVVTGLCREIIADGGYGQLEARTIALGLSAMTDGLWLSCLMSPRDFDREQALDAAYGYLRAVFPDHYH